MALHLHPAVLPVTIAAILGWLVFKPKLAKASVSSANRNLGLAQYGAQQGNLLGPSSSSSSSNTSSANSADYLDHLQSAVSDTAILHSDLTAQAQAGMVDPQQATHTMLQAFSNLQAPMDTLTVQRDLNVLGAQPALKEDGVQGSKTTQALKDFQGKMLLPSTGQVDKDTASALRRAVAAVLSQNANTATSGIWSDIADAFGISSGGMSVRDVQHALNAIAGNHLAEDGVMGAATKNAIMTFQQHNGLRVDGIVGPETASALRYYGAATSPNLQAYVDASPTSQVAGYGYPMGGYTSSGGW